MEPVAESRKRQRGFSVIEAMAAVALVGLAFVPLLVLQGQLTRTVLAAERAEIASRATANALARLEASNPLLVDRGEEDLGDATMVWVATPISERKSVRSSGGVAGRFGMQLFRIDVTIAYDSGAVSEFSVDKVGWIAEEALLQ